MAIHFSLIAGLLLATAVPASAAVPAPTKVTASHDSTDYSKSFGKRRQSTIEASFDLGRTTLLISGAQGRRSYDGRSYSGVHLAGTVWHDWTPRLSTKTAIAIASNSPVFARREIAQDISYKVAGTGGLTVGAKYASYYGGTDVATLSGGAAWYFRGGLVSYRFSAHDVEKAGNATSHLATLKVHDPAGSGTTQLWLAAGTTVHDSEVILLGHEGKYRGIHLQRVQPIKGPIGLSLGLGRTWYDTGAADYRGTKATIGLVINNRPKR